MSTSSPEKWRTTLNHRRLATRDEADRFFDLVRQYARERGVPGPGYICGRLNVPALVFEDRVVRISAAKDTPALEIVFKYPDGKITNSVIMVTDDGDTIRVHGEHVYVVPHIEMLASAAGLSFDREFTRAP
jgi:hypothetical protein